MMNGNSFVGWSDNSYISEHNAEGRKVMEAKFTSERFVTYRAYKFNFTGTPTDPPAVKSFVYGTTPNFSTTVAYVSWNGATEVVKWQMHGRDKVGMWTFIAEADKTGFETIIQANGCYVEVSVDGISANGSTLGSSLLTEVDFSGQSNASPPLLHADHWVALRPTNDLVLKIFGSASTLEVILLITPVFLLVVMLWQVKIWLCAGFVRKPHKLRRLYTETP